MRKSILLITFMLAIHAQHVFGQNELFNDVVTQTQIHAQRIYRTGGLPEEIREIVIIAVDSNANSTLPSWVNNWLTYDEEYITASTFNKYKLDITLLIDTANKAFRMPRYYLPLFNSGVGTASEPEGHVHDYRNIIAVLQHADSLFNFINYDFDGDYIVPIHFISIGPKSGGITGEIEFLTNDYDRDGNQIKIIVNRQSRASGENYFASVFLHEFGHGEFDFPDMDHDCSMAYNHYGLGGFDVMSCLGFNGHPSPYSPFLRINEEWIVPTPITSNNSNFILEEFQKNKKYICMNP